MIILHEGELLHTDSSAEILEHYGVKGMKWGKRARAAGRYLRDYGKEYAKSIGKSYAHPQLVSKAARLSSMYDLRKGNLSSALVVRNKAAIKRINDYVDDRVDLKDKHKSKQRQTKGFRNKVDNYVQYRRDVSDMNKKYAGRKGY